MRYKNEIKIDYGYRKCIDCEKSFHADNKTDWLCDKCSARLVKHCRISLNEKTARNWDDKPIREAWRKTSLESMNRLLSKCDGVNYGKRLK